MVGVPGRSRACKQCKQRRIACDLGQPQCAKCVKSKRSCEYMNKHIFVFATEGHKTKYRKECAMFDAGTHEETISSKTCSWDTASGNPIAVPSVNKLLQQALVASGISYGHDRGNASEYFALISSSLTQSADTALFAPALACYSLWRGRYDGNSTMIDVSHQLYMKGLKATKNALANPKTALNDVTLAACHALGLYEALECPDKSPTAYRWHRAACCQIVHLRGSKAHREGLGHDLFASIRIFAVLEAIEYGEPMHLADEDWMTTPWEGHPKTRFDKLIDICMLSPAIVMKANGMKSVPGYDLLDWMVSLVSDIAALIHKFDAYYDEFFESRDGIPAFWEDCESQGGYVESDGEKSASPLIFEPTLSFPDLDTASILFMNWSSQLSLWLGIADLSNLARHLNAMDKYYSAIRRHLGQGISLTPEAIQARWLDMARKVCGSVAYCTTPSALESGPPRISTALNMLIESTRNRKACEKEFVWAIKARQEIARKWVRLLGYIPVSDSLENLVQA